MMLLGAFLGILAGLISWAAWLVEGSPAWFLGLPVLVGMTGIQVSVCLLVYFVMRMLTCGEGARRWILQQHLADLGAGRSERVMPILAFLGVMLMVVAGVSGPALPPYAPGFAAMTLLGVVFDVPMLRRAWPPGPKPFPLPPIEFPEPSSGDSEERMYAWSYLREPRSASCLESANFSLRLRRAAYEAAKLLERYDETQGLEGLAQFVLRGTIDEVKACAARIGSLATEKELTYLQTANFVLGFCSDNNNFPYAFDEETHSVPQYTNFPIETLWERRGDCEDHAVLAAAVLRCLGYDVILVVLHGEGYLHGAVGLAVPHEVPGVYLEHDGRKYYYGEATPSGPWFLGECTFEGTARLVPIIIA